MRGVAGVRAWLGRNPRLRLVLQPYLDGIRKLRFARRHRMLTTDYLRSPGPHCLHLGAGSFSLPGWLNSDLVAQCNVVPIDTRKPLPFPDGSFDFVFSEHHFEHIDMHEAERLLLEARRILRPGGIMRIATPDLQRLIGVYLQPEVAIHQRYLAFARDRFIPDLPVYSEAALLNNFFRAWGHQFIYDFRTLASLAERCGFVDAVRCQVGESAHPPLQGIERHGDEIGDDFNRLETMVLEVRRPPIAGNNAG